jgi:hypothetical protein
MESVPPAAGVSAAAAAISRQRMFAAGVMPRRSDVAVPIAGLIALEVVERLRPATGKWSMVAIVRVVAVIYVPIETMRPVKPGPSTDKDAAVEPIRPIVPVRRAIVGSVVKVPVGTNRCNADSDGYLGRCSARGK